MINYGLTNMNHIEAEYTYAARWREENEKYAKGEQAHTPVRRKRKIAETIKNLATMFLVWRG